jgi:MFS family permease
VALVAYSILGLIPMLLDDLFYILASRFVVGVAEAAILTSVNALLGDYFVGDERSKWLGIQATIGPIAASGLILAGGALGSVNWHAPFSLYALGLLVLILVLVGTWEPKRPASQLTQTQSAASFPWTHALVIGAVTIAVAVIYFVQAVQLGRIFGDLGVKSPQKIGVMVTLASVGIVLGGLLYRRLSKRSVAQLFAIIFLAFSVGYLGVALCGDYRIGLPFAVIAQVANGLTLPTLISWALSKYDYANRGRGMGFWGSCFFIGTFLSPPVVSGLGVWTGSFLKSVAALGLVCLVTSVILWIVAALRPGPSNAAAVR